MYILLRYMALQKELRIQGSRSAAFEATRGCGRAPTTVCGNSQILGLGFRALGSGSPQGGQGDQTSTTEPKAS